MSDVKLLLGDCLDKLKELEDNSVDSIVTDPPYGLSAAPNSGKKSKGGFMGKQWDYDVPSIDIWNECYRVLKPGGHLLSFAGSRTYHRMAVRIEDAGFEIRDQIMWIYGSGFPKSMDISKQIDKREGVEREVIGTKLGTPGYSLADNGRTNKIYGDFHNPIKECDITAPATDLAKQWSGWGTALKPAHEPIVMARKPLSEKTVVDNVVKWGTGGINIDESRIGTTILPEKKAGQSKIGTFERDNMIITEREGRFPANLILDKEAGEMLDEQSGVTKSGKVKENKSAYGGDSNTEFLRGVSTTENQYGDIGGASRFFYCPKVSKKERNEGLDGFDDKYYELIDGVGDDVVNEIKNILKL
jgi:hypothetical protein